MVNGSGEMGGTCGLLCLERNRVKATRRKRMAAKKPPKAKRKTLRRTVEGNGLGSVLRACGLKLAAARPKHMQGGRKPALIETEECKQKTFHG
jgi:hypothetical protein